MQIYPQESYHEGSGAHLVAVVSFRTLGVQSVRLADEPVSKVTMASQVQGVPRCGRGFVGLAPTSRSDDIAFRVLLCAGRRRGTGPLHHFG